MLLRPVLRARTRRAAGVRAPCLRACACLPLPGTAAAAAAEAAFTAPTAGRRESGGGVRSEYVFAHLPVCRSGLPFLVCADWELVSSREQIHGDASWNLWLRDQVSVRVKSTE